MWGSLCRWLLLWVFTVSVGGVRIGAAPQKNPTRCAMCQFYVQKLKDTILQLGGPMLDVPGFFHPGFGDPFPPYRFPLLNSPGGPASSILQPESSPFQAANNAGEAPEPPPDPPGAQTDDSFMGKDELGVAAPASPTAKASPTQVAPTVAKSPSVPNSNPTPASVVSVTIPSKKQDRILNVMKIGPKYPPAFQSAWAGERWRRLMNQVYPHVQALCSVLMPDEPSPASMPCLAVLAKFSEVTDGLRFGARPDAVCFEIDLCTNTDYIFDLKPPKSKTLVTKN